MTRKRPLSESNHQRPWPIVDASPPIDPDRAQRIEESILAGTTTDEQRLRAWHSHLKSHLRFPLIVTYLGAGITPLCGGAIVQAIGLAPTESSPETLQLRIMDGQRSVAIPLALLSARDGDDTTREALADWAYWHAHRYGH